MKAVAQCNDAARLVARNRIGQAVERLACVLGWQEHAATRGSGAFLQVQIGHQQRCMRGPDGHAGTIGQQLGATDEYGECAAPIEPLL